MTAEWDRPVPPSAEVSAPILSTQGFEGPLDWLLEQARLRRIDLRRLSILRLVETFEIALREALADDASAATIVRWGDWLVLAAELTLLRSRLLLPSAAETADARNEAEALRRRLIARAETAVAAAWLGRQDQLGIAVFERGAPEQPRGSAQGRVGDVTGLLRACLAVLTVPGEAAAAFRVSLPSWGVTDAVRRIRQWLVASRDPEAGLETFLPAVPRHAPEREWQCRAAVASTFVGGLELAREGTICLTQVTDMGPIAMNRPR